MSKEQTAKPVTAWAVYTPKQGVVSTGSTKEWAWLNAHIVTDMGRNKKLREGYSCREVVVMEKSYYDQLVSPSKGLPSDEEIEAERKARNYQTFQFDIGAAWMKEKVAPLLSRIETLEAENRWISVEERLPEENVGVLVFIPEEDMHITSGMWDVSKKWVLLDEHRTPDCKVTHWKPLGDIPEAYRKERDENNRVMEFLRQNIDPSVFGGKGG